MNQEWSEQDIIILASRRTTLRVLYINLQQEQ
jgi:hypothetical protein